MRKTFGAMFALAAACAVLGAAPQTANALTLAKPLAATQNAVTAAAYRDRVVVRHVEHRRPILRHRFVLRHPFIIHRSADNGCFWIKRRAINTGSGYWWRRYEQCRYS